MSPDSNDQEAVLNPSAPPEASTAPDLTRGSVSPSNPDAVAELRDVAEEIVRHGNLRQAEHLCELGQFEGAIAEYRRLLEHQPRAFAVLRGLGDALRRSGDHAGALAAFRDAVMVEPSNLPMREAYAQECVMLEHYEEARQAFLHVLGSDPNSPSARNGLALLLAKQGEFSEALTQFELATRAAPDNAALRNSVASTLFKLGRFDEATRAYRQALAIDERFAPAYHGLGLIHRQSGDRSDALAAFQAAINLAPKDPWHRLEAAVEGHALGEPEDHILSLQTIVAEFPAFAPALDHLAAALRRSGRPQEALSAVERASALEPDNAWLLCTRGELLRETGRLADARETYEEALKIRSQFAPALIGLGRLAQERGDHDAAIAAFQAAVAAEPNNLWSITELGQEYAATGRFEEAQRALFTALERDERFAPALNARGLMERGRGDVDAAVASFESAVDAEPGNVWYRLSFASALAAADRPSEAEVAYQRILERNPGFAGAHNGLGHLYRDSASYERAETAFAAATQHDPDNLWYRQSLASVLLDLGRLEEAKSAYAENVTRRSDFAPALQGLAAVLTKLGDSHGALEALRKASAYAPEDASVKAAIVGALLDLRRFDEAERAARENVALNPASSKALIELANCLKFRAPGETVLATLRKSLELEPGAPGAHCALGFEYLRQWRLSDADVAFDAALNSDPNFEGALIGKGLVLRNQGRRALALSQFEATHQQSGSAWAAAELAQEYLARDDDSAARATLQSALNTHRSDRHLLMQLGYLERGSGRRDSARAAFAQARTRHPQFLIAHIEEVRETLASGRLEQAIDRLTELLRANPDDPDTLEAAAEIFQMADRNEEALAIFALVAGNMSSRSSPHFGRARLMAALGRPDRAIAIMEGLAGVHGAWPEFFVTKAALLRNAGFLKDAMRTLEEGVNRLAGVPALLQESAAVAIEMGDFAGASLHIDRLQSVAGRQIWLLASLDAARWNFSNAHERVAGDLTAFLNEPARVAFATKIALVSFDLDAAERLIRAAGARDLPVAKLRGEPSHALESHFGHLLAEWRLDGEALARTRQALSHSDDAVGALLAVVAEFPDYTPASIALFAELRRRQRLTTLAAATLAYPRGIPSRIAQFWDQDDLPFDLERLSESWRDNHPGWAYERFSQRSALDWLRAHRCEDAARAFARAREPAQKADIFRLAWLAEEGGFWADIDDRCVAPIDRFARGGRDFVVCQEDLGSIGNNFIGARPAHPLVLAALQAAVESVNRGDNDILWLSTGPGLMTRTLAAAAARNLEAFLGDDGPLVLERKDLSSAIGMHCSTAYKHLPKHWRRSVRGRAAHGFGRKLDELLTLAGLDRPDPAPPAAAAPS